MRTQTRSRMPCASRSRRCANGSAHPRSSPPCPAPGTASTLSQTPGAREETVDRAPGSSVRLKLTLSYAGFLMVAGVLLLAVVWVFLLRYVPERVVVFGPGPNIPSRSDLLAAFTPKAAIALVFLLLFGLVGGWLLAGQ